MASSLKVQLLLNVSVISIFFFKSSCVSKENCDRDNDAVTGPREDFTQSGLAETAECPDSSNQVCCHYEDVTDEYFDTIESCSDHKHDGYRYV